MKTTMTVNLDRFRSQLEDDTIQEQPDRFVSTLSLGGGRTLLLSCPKELPIRKPDISVDPFGGFDDLEGALTSEFGSEYELCTTTILPGLHIPATDEQPSDRFDIEVRRLADALDALVAITWPMDRPPENAGMDSELARKYRASAYYRIDPADVASGTTGHGIDIWALPLSQLGAASRDELARLFATREAEAKLAVKNYQIDAPYFIRLFHEDDDVIERLGWHLEYGEDFATLSTSAEETDHCIILYYDQLHLEAYHSMLSKIMIKSMAGGFLSGLAAVLMDM